MSGFLWVLFATLYLVMLVWLGFTTLRDGHVVLFWLGIVFPLLWVFGALMGPTERVSAVR